MGTENNHYPEFEYAAQRLSAYAYSVGTFVISLKGGGMTQFSPKDVTGFKDWLDKHKVRDITVDDGIPKTTRNEPSLNKKKRG
jgi:hypothetical protein